MLVVGSVESLDEWPSYQDFTILPGFGTQKSESYKFFNNLEPSVDQENDQNINTNLITGVIHPGGAQNTSNKYF